MRDKIRMKAIVGAKHLYNVGVKDTEGNVYTVEVEANTRNQAARYAESIGYEVRDVNMVG